MRFMIEIPDELLTPSASGVRHLRRLSRRGRDIWWRGCHTGQGRRLGRLPV
jgi:hypothetical protein